MNFSSEIKSQETCFVDSMIHLLPDLKHEKNQSLFTKLDCNFFLLIFDTAI